MVATDIRRGMFEDTPGFPLTRLFHTEEGRARRCTLNYEQTVKAPNYAAEFSTSKRFESLREGCSFE